jgi:hypothetical protein
MHPAMQMMMMGMGGMGGMGASSASGGHPALADYSQRQLEAHFSRYEHRERAKSITQLCSMYKSMLNHGERVCSPTHISCFSSF